MLCELLFGKYTKSSSELSLNISGKPDFKFWPSEPIDGGRVEPDLVVDVKTENGPFRLIIEVKWHADQSGENQLQRQWDAFSKKYGPENTYHVYLILDSKNDGDSALQEAEDIKERRNRFKVITWHEICRNAQIHRNHSDWFEDVEEFLSALGVVPFTGFEKSVNKILKIPASLSTVNEWQIERRGFTWLPEYVNHPRETSLVISWKFHINTLQRS